MRTENVRLSVLAILISSISCQALAAPDQTGLATPKSDPCAQNTGQVVGALFGAVLGGFLGNKIGQGNGKKAATAIGALGGLALGNYIGSEMDRRKCELSKIAQKNGLTVVVADITAPSGNENKAVGAPVGMSVSIEDKPDGVSITDSAGGDSLGNVASSTQFQSGSDVLSPTADSYFREIAAQYALPFRPEALPPGASQEQIQATANLRQKRLLVLGHTDDTGNSRLNADLSEHRAHNVARLFAAAGVPDSQIYYQGSGETQPIADNRTEEGRAKNRRVEIVDLSDETAFQNYLQTRATNANFYRVTPITGNDAAREQNSSQMDKSAEKIAKATPSKAAPPLATTERPGHATVATPAPERGDNGYDFGGRPLNGTAMVPPIGKLITAKSAFSFNFIAPALADDMPMARSCDEDRPRLANAVKGLKNGVEYHVSEYLPNLYGTSWSDTVNGNIVALTGVAVLRDGAAPVGKPTLLIYKAAHGKADAASKADFRSNPDVNTYQGETGLLYRVFVNGPIKCMDVVFPREHPLSANNSSLFYTKADKHLVADINLKIAK
jgi:outer membrane protein OmpA-like peptidoglycan-associated protein